MSFICSCSNNIVNNRAIDPENLIIPDTLFDFFPNNNKMKLIYFSTSAEKMDLPYIPSEFSTVYYTKVFQCNDEVYWETIKNLKSQSINNYDVNLSNNYFIIDDERYLIKKFGIDTLKQLYSHLAIEKLSFSFHSNLEFEKTEFFDSETLTGLAKDFNILIIKRGSSFVISDKNYNYNWEVLSERNKHGYIGGIAYSDQRRILIYNIVAW
jgi:hypothetical protein